MGLGRTRRAARQLVTHGHILVNGNKVDIPSYLCSPKDKIALKESSRTLAVVKDAQGANLSLKPFVTFDVQKGEGTFVRIPERSELNLEIDENLIVEYYNRLV